MRRHGNLSRLGAGIRQHAKALTVFVLLAGILLYPPARSFAGNIVHGGASYLWSAERGIKDIVGGIFAAVRSKTSLADEAELLRQENTRLQAQVLDRNLLFEEVARFEERAGRNKGDNRLYARVLGGATRSAYDTFLVDVGSDQGVVVGNRVVYVGSATVGEVVEVSSQFSKIQLYSSPGLEQEAIISSTKTSIVAEGKGMGNFEAHVPEDSLVHIGDIVVSQNGDFILGTVEEIERKPASPFVRIFFRLPFNTSEVRSVEIIKNI